MSVKNLSLDIDYSGSSRNSNSNDTKIDYKFMCCIATPITIFIIISPFIINFYDDNNNINIKLSSIFRFVCTIPIVSTIVFIYFNIPKYNEYIALKFETRAIVQIICGTFLASNLLISFLLYSLTDVVRPRFLMLINGNIQIIASFLLFYVSTGFILPKLGKIILADLSFRPHGQNIPNSQKNRLHLVFTSSDHKPNKNNINSLPIPGLQWNTDPSVSAEKKLRKTISIWRRRKDMKLTENTEHTTTTKTKSTPNNELNNDIIINSEAKYKYDGSTISPPMSYDTKTVNHTILSSNDCIDFSVFDGLPPQYENKMPSAFSETFTTNNRKGTFSKNTVTSTINPTRHIQHTHIDTITSATGTTQQRYYMLSLLEQSNKSPKTRTDIDQDKRFEIIHTPIGGAENINDEFGEIIDTNLEEVVLNETNDVSDDGIYDDTNVVNEEAMNKGYSHSKQMSATHIFTSTTGLHSSAAIITPQISKTDSKPHSRRTSGVFNALELLNINISNTNKSNHSNKSSKNYDNNSTPTFFTTYLIILVV